ncbi:MAG TPA: hypothetical protein VLM89_06140 [Phycisphaerae bacterium]|nr:hypothetical protein [Phycisphaerae bacterium]
MSHPFVEFLIERDLIPPEIGRQLAEQCNIVREPIGMIAFSHGIIRSEEIDGILDRQRECKQRFGDIAVDLGILRREQVETLVKIQELRISGSIAEALALAGVVAFEDTAQYLGAFLVRDREVEEMMAKV